MIVDQSQLELLDSSGNVQCATVILEESDGQESGFPQDEIRVTLQWGGGEARATALDYFSAFCRIREELTARGLMPACYGACRNLVLSGMCFNMGYGLKGYLARLGQQTRMTDLVNIFDAGPDMDLVSVPEQRVFKEEWLSSLERKT